MCVSSEKPKIIFYYTINKDNKILESLANPKISFGYAFVFPFEKIEVVFHLHKSLEEENVGLNNKI
jgi:hypothetical protein